MGAGGIFRVAQFQSLSILGNVSERHASSFHQTRLLEAKEYIECENCTKSEN